MKPFTGLDGSVFLELKQIKNVNPYAHKYFQENDVDETITNPKNTTLLACFKLNQVDADAQMLKYHEIPEHYVWN